MLEFRGPRIKPQGCTRCPRHGNSTGFVADTINTHTQVVLLKYQPTKDEINYRGNLLEDWEEYLPPGASLSTLGIANVLRCKGEKDKESKKELVKLERICRKYDYCSGDSEGYLKPQGLVTFNPSFYIITYDYRNILKAAAFKVFLRKAFELAFQAATQGHKSMILSGIEAAELIFPELFSNQDSYTRDTAFRSWIGHWQLLKSWPFGKDIELITGEHKDFLDL